MPLQQFTMRWVKLTDPQTVEADFTNVFTELMGFNNDITPCPSTEVTQKGLCVSTEKKQ